MKRIIKVDYGRTISTSQFENAKIYASITEEISDKNPENNQKIFERLFEECEYFVLEKCQKEVEE